MVTLTLDGIYNWIFREFSELKLSWADRLVFREFPSWSCLGRTAWFLESFQVGTVLGGPPGFRESPEVELSWADRLVIGESLKWSCSGQIA